MKRPEILAPAGNFEKMKAAITASMSVFMSMVT